MACGLPVGWAALVGGGAVAGIGFTVSLLIASLAFEGRDLEEAKLGVFAAAIAAAAIGWLVFRAIDRLPAALRARELLGRRPRTSSTSRRPSTRRAITSAGRWTRR